MNIYIVYIEGSGIEREKEKEKCGVEGAVAPVGTEPRAVGGRNLGGGMR